MEQRGMSRSATEEVAALAARAAGKTLPEQSEVWRFFWLLVIPLQLCFFECKNFGGGSA